MLTPVTFQKPQDVGDLPMAKLLDEALWQGWVFKDRAQEGRNHAMCIRAVKWISLAGLLLATAAGLWSDLTPYDIIVRFMVAAGALVLMFQAFHLRRYAFATVRSTCAGLQSCGAGIQFFRGMAVRSRGGKCCSAEPV
jgi:hypothetical protein